MTSYPTEGRNASPGWRVLADLRALRDLPASILDVEGFALCVAIKLRENSATGSTTASLATFAADAKLSRSTTYRRLRALIAAGIVNRKQRRNKTSELSVRIGDDGCVRQANSQIENWPRRDSRLACQANRDVSGRHPNSLTTDSHINSHKGQKPGAAQKDPISELERVEEAVRIFEGAREKLRVSVQAEVFRVWVRPLRPLGFRNGSLVVAVPDPAFSCYLASEGQAGLGGLTMQAWLESLIGHGVEFVLKEPDA